MISNLVVTILLYFFLPITLCIFRIAPVWLTSPYIKTGKKHVITSLTGNSSLPTATIPFPGSAFLSVPNIGYGTSSYSGN